MIEVQRIEPRSKWGQWFVNDIWHNIRSYVEASSVIDTAEARTTTKS